MAKGIFPQMSIPDITNALAGWGLSVSQEQLQRPTAEFVEGVYHACLQQVTEISIDSLRDPVQNALAATVGEEKAARVEDFNAKDIASPERERTLILLSAFINFVKFTEQYCNTFVKDLRDRSEAIIVERAQISEQLAELERNIDALKFVMLSLCEAPPDRPRPSRAKIAEDEPRCEQLRNENNALRAKMIATKEFQTAAVQEVEKLKAEKNALVKRKEALNSEIGSVSDTITRTRSRIVQSPERIKRTITTMSSTAADDKKTVIMQEEKARDLQTKIKSLLNIEKDVRGCIEQLQTIEKEVRSLQVSQKELADLRDHLDDKKIERNELKLRQERVEKQLSNAHEKLERAQRHAEEKKLASQRTIDRLQHEYDQMAVERRDNDKQVEELRAEANEVERKMADQVKKGEAELNELLAEYWKLRHETDVYMETLANKLNMRVESD
ncbi:hypothetical protein H0H87_001461 [Tephrocybe sp. NHM501043]|nr:hypothetical protein H0H87_001461 [Tephrocybe sp. NHM501043]